MLTDFWAHHYFNNPNAGQDEFEDPDFEEELRKLEQDPDEWEPVT